MRLEKELIGREIDFSMALKNEWERMNGGFELRKEYQKTTKKGKTVKYYILLQTRRNKIIFVSICRSINRNFNSMCAMPDSLYNQIIKETGAKNHE